MAIWRFPVFVLLICLCAVVVQAQTEESPVQVEVHLDRTAIWLGDLVEYRIVLSHGQDIEIIRDNLEAEDINLEPFTLVDMEMNSWRAGENRVLEIVFTLTILETSGFEAAIPPLNVYYATREPGPLGKGTEIETHTLVIPEQKVGLRSTLTSDSQDIRDAFRVDSPSWLAGLIWIPGWIVVGLFALQGARWSLVKYRERTGKHQQIDRKTIEQQALNALDQLGAVAGRDELPERCQRITEILQGVISDVVELKATALTPEELREELTRNNVNESVSDQVSGVLEECEAARYADPALADGDRDLSELIGSCREAITRLARS